MKVLIIAVHAAVAAAAVPCAPTRMSRSTVFPPVSSIVGRGADAGPHSVQARVGLMRSIRIAVWQC